MSSQYRLKDSGEFIINNYNFAKPWSSFFPGIAGLFGIPMWAFYVNRGQCIVSLGIRSKDDAIMEFLPANKAYQVVASNGFRTFIKIKNKKDSTLYEPFSIAGGISCPGVKNSMSIRAHDLTLDESNEDTGLKVSVNFFPIVNQPYAALARELCIENISDKTKDIEALDGLAVIFPCGINNWFLKEMSRTIEAWMGVENVDTGVPIFKLSTDPRDTSQVSFIKSANFYTSFESNKTSSVAKIIVDPSAVFGEVLDFSYPLNFAKVKNYAYPRIQSSRNKTPCAFTYLKASLPKGKTLKLYSLVGHISDAGSVRSLGIDRLDSRFMESKKEENRLLICGIMDRIFTASAKPEFDLYARQTYLDNVLRGGLPYSVKLDGSKKTTYVFSRKHGDLERDYNRFFVSATYFSEGEGNYRDVNQNRRCDLFFDPLTSDKNIRDFMDLIQLDGYNPLIFKGERFIVEEKTFFDSGLGSFFHDKDAKKIAHIVSRPFTLGEILGYIQDNKVFVSSGLDNFVKKLLLAAKASVEASFGEGYWSDHWTYNTDLLESFSSVYPDNFKELLFNRKDFTFYDAHAYVKPRSQRYVLLGGHVRQYHGIATDEEKCALMQKRHDEKNKVRAKYGDGAVFTTTLLDKLICLAVNKLATLDPFGVGIEMEADKPNWYDALNGLPGLFGSSVSETFELKRLIVFLNDTFNNFGIDENHEIELTEEVFVFMKELETLLKSDISAFDYWDMSNIAKESYRAKTRNGVCGDFRKIKISDIKKFFQLALSKLQKAIAASFDKGTGAYTTYFSYTVTGFDTSVDSSGRHIVTPKEFSQHKLALFLEGFVHALRTEKEKAAAIYNAVKNSPLWDKKLKMYKVNASLKDESFEIGRTKAFTPGWLENESVWLHMEYKYLLELLKTGLYKEFYNDIPTALIPFMDASKYGRSILESSSFIASSAHPDSSMHGRGFVARLSGSTAEFINMWLLMNTGPRPFFLDKNGKLALRLSPALPAGLFLKKSVKREYVSVDGKIKKVGFSANTYAFLFLSKTLVVYKNPSRKDTFGKGGVRPKGISLFGRDGLITRFDGTDTIGAPYAEMARNGELDRIEIELG